MTTTSKNGRYFVNDGEPLPQPNYHQELLESLTRINLYNPPVQTCSTGWRFEGLYSGPTSIAYLFYRLSQIYPSLEFKGQSLLDWAQAYLDLTAFGPQQPVHPEDCGILNETLASLALKAVMTEDASLVQQLCNYQVVINSDREPGSNECFYGRAGYLYFLRLVRSVFGSHQGVGSLIVNTIHLVTDRILRSPQPWIWFGKPYLGTAHGSIGIVTQLALSGGVQRARIEPLILDLLSHQFDSGNFPSSLDDISRSNDERVHFCHGAPGFVLALRSLRDQYGSMIPHIDEVILSAQSDTWKRGLLTKPSCLCHGIAGNALALDDEDQFIQFLAHMSTAQLEHRGGFADAGRSNRFTGLYSGEAGRAWVWAVADKALPRTCIGFNDI